MIEKKTNVDNLHHKNLKSDEEVNIMPTALKIIEDEKVFSRGMEMYLRKLQEQAEKSRTQAKKDAIKALKKTGVIDKNGKVKERIVSWD